MLLAALVSEEIGLQCRIAILTSAMERVTCTSPSLVVVVTKMKVMDTSNVR